uniref:Uncharacterized protein n=1 Tax=Timema cristinae TaxID=61476 RepID=A0A7R9D4V8_TIMCR|nr:unnamed protein product [Timema cristinae]
MEDNTVGKHLLEKKGNGVGIQPIRTKLKPRLQGRINESKMLPRMPTCRHNNQAFKCVTLTARDVNNFHQIVFKHPDKIYQDNLILKYCSATAPRRNRAAKDGRDQTHLSFYMNLVNEDPTDEAQDDDSDVDCGGELDDDSMQCIKMLYAACLSSGVGFIALEAPGL